MSIELLKEEDWEKYLKIRFQLGQYLGIHTLDSFKEKYESINNQGGYIFVIKMNNMIVATAKLLIEIKFFDNIGHIEDVVVDVNYRGQGLGVKIVNNIIKFAKDNGCYKVVCSCIDSLEKFYSNTGLELSGITMSKFVKEF